MPRDRSHARGPGGRWAATLALVLGALPPAAAVAPALLAQGTPERQTPRIAG